MSITQQDMNEKISRLVTNSLEVVLVHWHSESSIEVIDDKHASGWFDSPKVALEDICRYEDLSALAEHFEAISGQPSSINFTINVKGEKISIFCSSEEQEGVKTSLWMKMPGATLPMEYMQDAVHDMKAPINVIIGVANVMQHKMGSGMEPEEFKTLLEMIKANANQSVSLFHEVIELAEMEAASFELPTESVDLSEFVQNYLDTHRLLTLKKKIKVHFQKVDGLQVKINRMKMTRVFDNILSNAVKFSEHGSNIHVTLSKEPDSIDVSIRMKG